MHGISLVSAEEETHLDNYTTKGCDLSGLRSGEVQSD